MKVTFATSLMLAVVALVMDEAEATQALDRWNWSHNIEFTAKKVEKPSMTFELVKAVEEARGRVKVVGTAHSFNDIADTDGTHISLENFKEISVDTANHTVTFGAGVTYTELIKALVPEKMALSNLPSLPHLNVVGSVVTGTHGSGTDNLAIASYVTKVSYVDPSGKAKHLVRSMGRDFWSFLHSFGTLGIIYEMTMDIVPEYGVTKCIYQNVPWDFLYDKKQYKKINEDWTYLSYFADFQSEHMSTIWVGKKIAARDGDYSEWSSKTYQELCAETFYGGTLTKRIHPVNDRSSEPCVESGFGMWNEKIYHFKPD